MINYLMPTMPPPTIQGMIFNICMFAAPLVGYFLFSGDGLIIGLTVSCFGWVWFFFIRGKRAKKTSSVVEGTQHIPEDIITYDLRTKLRNINQEITWLRIRLPEPEDLYYSTKVKSFLVYESDTCIEELFKDNPEVGVIYDTGYPYIIFIRRKPLEEVINKYSSVSQIKATGRIPTFIITDGLSLGLAFEMEGINAMKISYKSLKKKSESGQKLRIR